MLSVVGPGNRSSLNHWILNHAARCLMVAICIHFSKSVLSFGRFSWRWGKLNPLFIKLLSSLPPIDYTRAVIFVWMLKRKDYQNCSMLFCVQHLCTVTHTRMHARTHARMLTHTHTSEWFLQLNVHLALADLGFVFLLLFSLGFFLQCFDAVGWASGRASGL